MVNEDPMQEIIQNNKGIILGIQVYKHNYHYFTLQQCRIRGKFIKTKHIVKGIGEIWPLCLTQPPKLALEGKIVQVHTKRPTTRLFPNQLGL